MGTSSSNKHLSPLAAWAFAFGTAVGWGAFVMPGTLFLPKAGPLGTSIGVFVGAAIMAVIAWNYHYMTRCQSGPGGAFAFASRAFGIDHGFLCAWFLSLTYMAIIWANATALTIVGRGLFGDMFRFGFSYKLAGYDIFFGDILFSGTAILAAAAICCRRRLAGGVQTALAVLFAVGIATCFAGALLRCGGDLRTAAPAFAPDAQPFDLVLSDMWMPNLDGKGLVRAIRANPALSSLRVVAVTADVESQGTFAAMGFDDLLLKPVTVDKLGKILAGDRRK